MRSHYRDLLRAKWKPLPSDSEASTSEPDPDSDPEERDLRRRDRERRRARTKLRIAKLRNYDLPDEYKNADAVTEWMDSMGFQRAAFAWFQDLENKCRKVELEN